MKKIGDFTLFELYKVCVYYKGTCRCNICPLRDLTLQRDYFCNLLNSYCINCSVNNDFSNINYDEIVLIDIINDNSLKNVLKRNGFVALNELLCFSKRDILKLRGFGIVKLDLLNVYLKKYFNKEIN